MSGAAAPVEVKTLPPSDSWPGWCGAKVKQRSVAGLFSKSGAQSYYMMIDGQRLAGVFEMGGLKPSWRNAALQSVPIDLEQTLSIGPFTRKRDLVSTKDMIILVNSDRLEGFIDSVDVATGIGLEVATPAPAPGEKPGKQVMRIPMDRIAEIRLASKSKPAGGWRIWLADGSAIDVDSWSDDQNQCRARRPHAVAEMESVVLPWTSVLAIAPNSNAMTVLANCPWKAIPEADASATRLSPPTISSPFIPTAFDATPLDLHGPGAFQFSFPKTRGTLSMTLSIPPQLGSAVGCHASIESNGKILWQGALTPEFAATDLRLPFEGEELTVRLDQSKRGAFGCALRLGDAIVISDSCSESPPPTRSPASAPAKSDL